MGNIVLRKQDVAVWPFFESHETEDQNSKYSKGAILLLFHYDRCVRHKSFFLLQIAAP